MNSYDYKVIAPLSVIDYTPWNVSPCGYGSRYGDRSVDKCPPTRAPFVDVTAAFKLSRAACCPDEGDFCYRTPYNNSYMCSSGSGLIGAGGGLFGGQRRQRTYETLHVASDTLFNSLFDPLASKTQSDLFAGAPAPRNTTVYL